jgi:hypothetical protein
MGLRHGLGRSACRSPGIASVIVFRRQPKELLGRALYAFNNGVFITNSFP